MMCYLIFSLLAVDAGAVTYKSEGVFEPLLRSDVAVAKDGHVFILDFKAATVSHYDANGELLNTIGKKGNGPGEFNFPGNVFIWDGYVYLEDRANSTVSRFERNGKYVDRVRIPARGMSAVKVKDGWVTAKLWGMDPSEEITVTWMDEKMENSQEIASYKKPEGAGGAMMVRQTGSGRPKVPYNPVRDNADILADRDGRYVYVYIPGNFDVKVIDSQTRKVVNTITTEQEPILFNEEYGNEQLAEFQEGSKKRGMPIDFVPDFPDFFPYARELFISAENNLGVRRWTSRPDEVEKGAIFDHQGKPIKVGYSVASARRVLLIQDGFAYINAFDAEKEAAFLIKAPVAKIDEVVATNPIDYSLEEPRMMIQRH